MVVKMLPAALVPTLAIELAPPALGGTAYFAHGTARDAFAYALAGYGVQRRDRSADVRRLRESDEHGKRRPVRTGSQPERCS